MDFRHVRQEDPSGCAIASLAMATGRTYAEVRAGFPGRDFVESGISSTRVDEYLIRAGYALRKVTHYDPIAEEFREPWPPAPFADIHICEVVTSRSHTVIMLRDGTVLDPLTTEPRRLADYARVYYVAGVYNVRAEAKHDA